MLKAPPTILTPEAIGLGFILWLVSIVIASLAMNMGKLAEIWMFAVMSWPLVLGVVIVKVERTILQMRGDWSPVQAHELVRQPQDEGDDDADLDGHTLDEAEPAAG